MLCGKDTVMNGNKIRYRACFINMYKLLWGKKNLGFILELASTFQMAKYIYCLVS